VFKVWGNQVCVTADDESVCSTAPFVPKRQMADMNSVSPGPSIERRLAAIVFIDVVGFSALMETEDARTMHRWKDLRSQVLEPKIAEHRGRLLRVVGDALFVEFRSAVDAVRCSQDIQRAIASGKSSSGELLLPVRIGINVEDVIVEADDLHGDGVNIAARIQQLADAGQTLVTAAVRDYVRNKLDASFTDLGEKTLKNISRPVRILRLDEASEPSTSPKTSHPHLLWGNRAAIAVLPFRNLANDPDQRYFGEGITEDIIAGLARSRSFHVIARQSTLPYADRHADMRQIASELSVRYVVDGSVRRQNNALRISSELIDAHENVTIWTERYQGSADEIFDFQDRIASGIVAAIEPQVFKAETARARRKQTENLDAYDCLLRAVSLLYTFDDTDFASAADYLSRAIALDPGYAHAYAYRVWWFTLLLGEGRSLDERADSAAAEVALQRALVCDANDPFVLAIAGYMESFVHRRPEAAVELFDRSLQLNGNSAFTWGMSAVTYCYLGEAEKAMDRLRNAWRLSPFDPLNFMFYTAAGIASLVADRPQEAIAWAQKAKRTNSRYQPCLRTLAIALALAGREEEALAAGKVFLEAQPSFRVSSFAAWYPLQRKPDLDRFLAGLRAAGLPE